MASKTFNTDADIAAYEARMKALAKKRDAHLAHVRNAIGALAVASGVSNGLEDSRLFGGFLWLRQQLQANPDLAEEWDRLSATFPGKSRFSKRDANASIGNAVPAATGKPARHPDAGADDLLARTAAE